MNNGMNKGVLKGDDRKVMHRVYWRKAGAGP